jgi:uncharacterized protein
MKNFVRKFFRNSTVNLTHIPLGATSISLPVARLQGDKTGPTLCVTAGMDGDEYAGIAAAYELIHEFQEKQFAGTLIVLPIVNVPGFEKEMSYNPIDGKFLKNIYPGNTSGSPTEQLIYWLHMNVLCKANFWLDMHGGALTEHLIPYVHTWETGNREVDAKTKEVLTCISTDIGIYEQKNSMGKAQVLAGTGCGYIVIESGEFGHFSKLSINRHLLWAHVVMSCLGMVGKGQYKTSEKTIFRNVDEYTVKKQGLWYPMTQTVLVKRGQVLGIVRGLDAMQMEKIVARKNGSILWIKEGMRAKSGDIVVGVGCEEIHLA